MSWTITYEPLNAEDTIWLVTCAEFSDADDTEPLGSVQVRVKGNRAQAEVEGKRKILEVHDIRESRTRAEVVSGIKVDDLRAAPPPGPGESEFEVARRTAGLERTKRSRDETQDNVDRLTQELADAQERLQSLIKSIATEEAALAGKQ